jgi:hypothetical protein
MDRADLSDVSTIVRVTDITSKLKFKMNFSGHKWRMLACKTPSPVALENIAKSRCFLLGLVTGDEWQNDHGDASHKKMTGDNLQNDHGDDSQGWETGSSCNRCSRRLGPKAFTRTERTQKFKKNQLRGIWCLFELYLRGTYVTYPNLGSHYARVLSPVRYIQYLITMMHHM